MSSVLQAWIHAYGEEKAREMWKLRCKKAAQTLENYIIKFGETEGTKRYNQLREKHKDKGTLGWFIRQFGETEGTKRYYIKNKKISVGVESLKARGYSEDEIVEIKKRHSKNSDSASKEAYIRKYGKERGLMLYNMRTVKRKLTTKRCLEYWLVQCGGDEVAAKQKQKEYQTHDKKFFIEKYGEVTGLQKYLEMNKKRSQSLESYIKKFGEELGTQKYNKSCLSKKGQNSLTWYIEKYGESIGFEKYKYKCLKSSLQNNRPIYSISKPEMEVVKYILELIPNNYKSYYNNHQYCFFLNNEERKSTKIKMIYPDFYCKELNLVVEFFGDYWHCHPNTFKDESFILPQHKITVGEVRHMDLQKKNIFKNKNINYLVIWEYDWSTNKESIKKFLKEYILKLIQNENNK